MTPRRLTAMFLSIVAVAAMLATACGPVVNQQQEAVSSLHGDSGISRPSYESIVNIFKGHAQKHGSIVEYFEYGRTYQDRPLMGIRVWKKDSRPTGKVPAVLISEGIHGDEYLNVTDRLPGEFLDRQQAGSSFYKFLDKGGIVYFIPIINPDGFTAGRRENSKNADLNRDFSNPKANFTAFKQIETKSVSDFIATESTKHNFTLETSMEYHCCIGGLIHPNAYTRTPLPSADLTRHQDIGAIVKRKFKKNGQPYAVGTVHTMLQYPETFGGSDDYYLASYGRRAFSFEGNFQVEQSNISLHVDMWNEIFDIAGAPYTGTSGGNTSSGTEAHVAVGNDSTDGTPFIYAATSEAVVGPELCLGSKIDCSTGGSGQRVTLTLAKSANGLKYYKSAVGVRLNTAGDNVISVVGGLNGQSAVLSSVKIQRN